MKKKLIAILLVCLTGAALTACGTTAPATDTNTAPKAEAPAPETPAEPTTGESDLETMIAADVDGTAEKLKTELNAIYEATGDTYDGYKENVDKLTEWYAMAQSESTALYGRINESTVQYLKTIEASTEATDFDTWSDALDDSYKAWDRGMEDYYKAWNEMYDDTYKKYDRVISDAYEQVSYEEASDAWDDMYDAYSNSWDQMYRDYSDAWDDMYDLHSDIYDAVYDEEVNIDAIVNKTSEAAEPAATTEEPAEESTEANADADLSYYLEVTNRCNQKLLEVA